MSTQVTNDEPVLVLDDKKYLIENLSDDAKNDCCSTAKCRSTNK